MPPNTPQAVRHFCSSLLCLSNLPDSTDNDTEIPLSSVTREDKTENGKLNNKEIVVDINKTNATINTACDEGWHGVGMEAQHHW